ncbi:hypothetical protein ACIRJQ_11835, partial [Streptomyces avermitilis]
DPGTGLPAALDTGRLPAGPGTGLPVALDTGRPLVDPGTGLPAALDTGRLPAGPGTGLPVALDTGRLLVDPGTGLPAALGTGRLPVGPGTAVSAGGRPPRLLHRVAALVDLDVARAEHRVRAGNRDHAREPEQLGGRGPGAVLVRQPEPLDLDAGAVRRQVPAAVEEEAAPAVDGFG